MIRRPRQGRHTLTRRPATARIDSANTSSDTSSEWQHHRAVPRIARGCATTEIWREPPVVAAGPTHARHHRGVVRRCDRRWPEGPLDEVQPPLDCHQVQFAPTTASAPRELTLPTAFGQHLTLPPSIAVVAMGEVARLAQNTKSDTGQSCTVSRAFAGRTITDEGWKPPWCGPTRSPGRCARSTAPQTRGKSETAATRRCLCRPLDG
jgi:hypothetical protein